MTGKQIFKTGATAALAVFGAQAAHTALGKAAGIKGIGIKLVGGMAGVWLGSKLAK